MEKVDLRQKWPEIVYFGPVYGDKGGNCTEVLFLGGDSAVDPRRTKTVLFILARHFARDLTALRAFSCEYLGRRQGVPLPLAPGFLLVPVKVRGDVLKDDGATGYLVMGQVQGIQPVEKQPSRSVITFRDGGSRSFLFSPQTLRRRLIEARSLAQSLPWTGQLELSAGEGPAAPAPGRMVYIIPAPEGTGLFPVRPAMPPGFRSSGKLPF